MVPSNPEDGPETPALALPPKRYWKRYINVFRVLIPAVLVASLVGWYVARHQANYRSLDGPPSGASAVHGWIHTNGTALVDASGKRVILAGVDDSRLDAGQGNKHDRCDRVWSATSAADIANMRSLGFNMDRVGVSWANLEPMAPTVNPNGSVTHHWNMRYLAALDGEIRDIQADHMVAILDMHQSGWSPAFTGSECEGHGLPAWLYTTAQYSSDAVGVARCEFFSDTKESGAPEKPQEGFAAVWKMLARRYASNRTVVGADMFNEPNWPGFCTGANLSSFYDKVGHAIRVVNHHILLIYEDKAYSIVPVNDAFLLKQQPTLSNAVYSWHFYPTNWSVGRASLAAHLARAQEWSVPLWIGEFDGFGGSYNIHVKPPLDPNWQSDLRALMKYFKRNRISWSIWDYDYGGYSVVAPGTTRPKRGLMAVLKRDMP